MGLFLLEYILFCPRRSFDNLQSLDTFVLSSITAFFHFEHISHIHIHDRTHKRCTTLFGIVGKLFEAHLTESPATHNTSCNQVAIQFQETSSSQGSSTLIGFPTSKSVAIRSQKKLKVRKYGTLRPQFWSQPSRAQCSQASLLYLCIVKPGMTAAILGGVCFFRCARNSAEIRERTDVQVPTFRHDCRANLGRCVLHFVLSKCRFLRLIRLPK